MEEDEEIILQDSPLDAYLQEVTDSDFSRFQSVNEKSIFLEATGDKLPESAQKESNSGIVFNENYRRGSIEIIKICSELFNSNLLTSDDHSLLIELNDDIATQTDHLLVTEDSKLHTRGNLNLSNAMLIFGLFVLVAGIVAQVVSFDGPTLVFLSFLLFIAFAAVARVWCWMEDTRSVSREEEITKFIEKMHRLDKLLDRSVTHIKEVEVISAGFQMFRKPITKELYGKKLNKCLKLRTVMLDLLIDLFMELRVNERMLLQTYSDELLSMKEEFLAAIPLAKFNELISNEKPVDDLQLSNISLDKLKGMVYLYRVLLSEFTLTLIVCFYSNITDESHLHFPDLLHSIEQVVASSENHIGGLEQSLDKSIKLTFRKEDTSDIRCSPQSPKSPIDELFRKCKLNLYSSLTRIEEAELLVRENPTSFDMVTLENLSLQFCMNLDNAKACLEDVTDIFKPKDFDKKNREKFDEPTQRNEESEPVVSMVLPERETGDMMYEGESLEAALRSMDIVGIEDLEQQLKESRESKRLLRELKSIFAVKDSPVGLLSFPLTKVSETENVDQQLTDDDEDLFVLRKKKRGIITGDQDFFGEGEDNPDTGNYVPTAPIGIPANLLQGLSTFASREEERFGSSDDEIE